MWFLVNPVLFYSKILTTYPKSLSSWILHLCLIKPKQETVIVTPSFLWRARGSCFCRWYWGNALSILPPKIWCKFRPRKLFVEQLGNLQKGQVVKTFWGDFWRENEGKTSSIDIKFQASESLFENFKKRSKLCNTKLMKKFASGGEDSTEAFPEKWQRVVRKESSIYEPRVCRWRCFGSFSLKQNEWIRFVLKFDIFFLCFFVSCELKPSLLFPTSPPHHHVQKQEPRGYQGLLTFFFPHW